MLVENPFYVSVCVCFYVFLNLHEFTFHFVSKIGSMRSLIFRPAAIFFVFRVFFCFHCFFNPHFFLFISFNPPARNWDIVVVVVAVFLLPDSD